MIDGLTAGHAITRPGAIVDLDYRWHHDEWRADPLSWSRRREDAGQTRQSGGDTRSGRSAEPKYQTEEDRLAAEAVDWDDQCLVCIGIDA